MGVVVPSEWSVVEFNDFQLIPSLAGRVRGGFDLAESAGQSGEEQLDGLAKRDTEFEQRVRFQELASVEQSQDAAIGVKDGTEKGRCGPGGTERPSESIN